MEVINGLFSAIMNSYAGMIAHGLMRMMVIFVVVLGADFIAEHLLGVLKDQKRKNRFALFLTVSLSFWSITIYDMHLINNMSELIWRGLVYSMLVVVAYTLVGLDLFERFNDWCDIKLNKKPKE
jgi:hypothetical protein